MRYGLAEATIHQLSELFTRHTKIEKVILYGSRAKGSFRDGSDIDLTLYGPDLTLFDLNQINLQIDDLLLPYKVDLSLYQDIENPALCSHIQRVGKLFYSRADAP